MEDKSKQPTPEQIAQMKQMQIDNDKFYKEEIPYLKTMCEYEELRARISTARLTQFHDHVEETQERIKLMLEQEEMKKAREEFDKNNNGNAGKT